MERDVTNTVLTVHNKIKHELLKTNIESIEKNAAVSRLAGDRMTEHCHSTWQQTEPLGNVPAALNTRLLVS